MVAVFRSIQTLLLPDECGCAVKAVETFDRVFIPVSLRQDVADHVSVNIGQAVIASLKAVS